MSKVGRVAVIACCVGLVAALAGYTGQLARDLDPYRGGASVRQATRAAEPASGLTKQAASSVPTVDRQSARMTAARDLFSARAAAVKAGRKSAWMATVDVPHSGFGRRQSMAFDNLITLRLRAFSYGTVQLAHALSMARAQQVGPHAWVATVPGTYSLAGFDRALRSFEGTYTLVQRPGGWRIADDTDGATALQMWDLPGLRALRGQSAIVVGNAPQRRMRDYIAIADSAVRRLTGVWGTDWNARVVIVTPSTTQEYAALLSQTADRALDQVAAVTQGVIVPGQRAQEDRIVINPKAFTALQRSGRRVVMTHELTHVAVRSSTTRPVPIWLSEGMADYVAYSGLDLPRERVASELLALVRQGKGNTALPTDVDFDPSRSAIAPSYSKAWLAVSHLVDLYGQARVVAFYRAVAGGLMTDQAVQPDPQAIWAQAFTQSFGVSEAQFVDGWNRYLQTLAHPRG